MAELNLDDIMSMLADGQDESTKNGGSEDARASLSPLTTADLLKRYLAKLDEKQQFERGMLVTWKEGLRNKKKPFYGEPAIVIEVLDEPVMDKTDCGSGSPYYREPLDLMLGILDDDGELDVYHFDSRRFEPWTPNP